MILPIRVSFSTTESANLVLVMDLPSKFRGRHVRLVHLHEVDAHEERLAGLGGLVEIVDRSLLDVFIEKGNPDQLLIRGIDVLAVDFELLDSRPARCTRQRALGHPGEHLAQFVGMAGKPLRIGVGVGVEVIEANILHFVVALRGRQRIVGLA